MTGHLARFGVSLERIDAHSADRSTIRAIRRHTNILLKCRYV